MGVGEGQGRWGAGRGIKKDSGEVSGRREKKRGREDEGCEEEQQTERVKGQTRLNNRIVQQKKVRKKKYWTLEFLM